MIGYIYAMTCGEFIKIGFTRNIEQRRHALQTMCPYDVDVVQTVSYLMFRFDNNRPPINTGLLVERAIHDELGHAELHHRGEWFTDIEKTLFLYEELTTKWNNNYVSSRCEKFVKASDGIANRNISDRKKIQKALGVHGSFILDRFKKYDPRILQFLIKDHIERVEELLGVY